MNITLILLLAHSGCRVDRLGVPTRNEQPSEKQGKEDGQACGQATVQGHGPEREEVPLHVHNCDCFMKGVLLAGTLFDPPAVDCAFAFYNPRLLVLFLLFCCIASSEYHPIKSNGSTLNV